MALHSIAKKLGYKSNEDFYKDYPTKESYLKKYPDGGILPKDPIKTSDPNKVRAYNDSLQLHNLSKEIYNGILGDMQNGVLPVDKVPYHINKMDEIIPKTDSLVNDLYSMGIDYKVKGYNKVPIGSNGNYTEIGKLQKVAPAPKQPYFFKNGGTMPKYSFGSFLGNNAGSILSTIGGIALTATGAGAAVGVPMILGGVGGIAKGVTNEVQQNKLQETKPKSTSLLPMYNPSPVGSYKNGGELIKYKGASHANGGIKINKLGVQTNNPNDAVAEVEGGETKLKDYIFSDKIGLDKKGIIQTNTKKVFKTFADLSKKIDAKFDGRKDELSNATKNLMYTDLKNKNEQAIQEKKDQEFFKFQKAIQSFSKKWGGFIGEEEDDNIVDAPELGGYFVKRK